ncbi:MAG: xanthine dehydrogenase family protein [Rhodospirillaceae bacterium]|nr:xanthine dehydrogenase family protein [Rhodospirillaceae bacterium]
MRDPEEGKRRLVGAPVRRLEDRRFLTGAGRYTDDVTLARSLHAVFVRSVQAHADLVAVDIAEAAALPGVAAVFTGADLRASGVAPLGLDFEIKGPSGPAMIHTDRYPLAAGRVRYVGEPIAVVVAETREQAQDAADAVAVEYRELPAAADTAGAPAAPAIWAAAPDNVCATFRYGNRDATEALFAAAAHRVAVDLVNNRLVGNPMEPRAATAYRDRASGRLVLLCSNQQPHITRTHIANALGLPEHALRVISEDVGGAFGVKGPTYPEETALVWAALRLDRPVKWTCSRTELFLSDAHARDHVTRIELALDSALGILAVRVEDIANLGAYVSSFGVGPPIFAQAVLLSGPYRIKAYAGTVRMVFTNTVPTDAYRGAGRPENTYMLERAIDAAARALGTDPVELRRRNLVSAREMPYATPAGRTYDSGDFPRNLELVLEAADHVGLAARRAAARAAGKRIGFAVTTFVEHSGLGPSRLLMARGSAFGAHEAAHVRLGPAGDVQIVTGTHSHGQGLDTAFAQIVADRFGVPMDMVTVVHGDSDAIAWGRGTVGSRSLMSGGAALDVALGRIEEKAKRIAAQLLECGEEDVVAAAGRFTVAGTDRAVGMREIAREAYHPLKLDGREIELGLEATAYWDPVVVSFPNGAHACEVEADPDTGAVRILRYCCVDDFGNVVNPLIVDGQVHGGVAQGIGQALLETVRYDAAGQLVTGSFMDYAMPRADDLPAIATARNAHPCTTNPLGVKGCGESGTIGATPTVVNAILDALAEFGVRHIDMPATPHAVWRALRQSGGRA